MFDNAYNEVNVSYIEASSRPMRLQLDEQNFVATITWAFETGVHSTVYGDADLLPTGHVLASYAVAFAPLDDTNVSTYAETSPITESARESLDAGGGSEAMSLDYLCGS